ncbi:SDR family NAD(P)-dependent oxidoreductase [bacterium]|nr:SDR family NAD(P)-dependent oxidoreductase [bacterium]
MQLQHNKILITGGGSGIGYGLTQRFVQEGNTVIICGRRQDVLDEATKNTPGIITYCCDLGKEDERVKLIEWLSTQHADTNVLVNNAGIQQWMHPHDDDFYSRAKAEIAINVEAPLHLTQLFAKHLKKASAVLNVTSGLSFVQLNKVPVYCATKAFFHSLTISMRELLRPDGIEVIELVPPALNTDLGGRGLHDSAPPVSAFVDAVFQQLQQGKEQITFGFSEMMAKAGPDEIQATFKRMNNLTD